MNEVLHGVVHGNTIELERSPQVGEGQAVEVVLRPIATREPWGEGLRRCAGALADDPEIDAILDDIERERTCDSSPSIRHPRRNSEDSATCSSERVLG